MKERTDDVGGLCGLPIVLDEQRRCAMLFMSLWYDCSAVGIGLSVKFRILLCGVIRQ